MSLLGGDHYKPAMAMLGLQFTYAGVSLFSRAALLEGMSPRVSVVYRQAMATLIIAPIAYFSRRKSGEFALGWRSFNLIFLASFIGVTINQNIFYEGLYLASSSMGSAMGNLVPAITFFMAVIVGFEKIDIKSTRSITKIVGTLICVGGAVCMALLKGPKLLNSESLPVTKPVFGSGGANWLLGCLLLFGSSCCWSFWLILQVPVSASYPDHLSLSAWMGLFATIQSAIVTLFLEPDPNAWILRTNLEFAACFIAGIGSGVSFFVQAWCISKMGPLFSAMFNPLCTVITTILAALFLQEQIYAGSATGAIGVVIGLYIVLWGKAGDHANSNEDTDSVPAKNSKEEDSSLKMEKTNLEEPLLVDTSEDIC